MRRPGCFPFRPPWKACWNSILAVALMQSIAAAQTSPAAPSPETPPLENAAQSNAAQSNAAQSNAAQLTPEQSEQVEQWIDSLGSSEFAERERAAIELMELGLPVVSKLRDIAKTTSDAEVRLRAKQIVMQLTEGDLQSRIDDFLAGRDVHFDGWRITQAILGDSFAVRQLFVDMMRKYPGLPTALEGTTRDRAMVMDQIVSKIRERVLRDHRMPSRTDAFALLLPSSDPAVPLNAAFENQLLALLKQETASKIRLDPEFAGPFSALLSHWIPRSTLTNREEVLLFGMEWNLARPTLTLAFQTLTETTSVDPLATAMQAISRFGNSNQVELLQIHLNDQRLVSEGGFVLGKEVQTQLRDVAMAAIARVHGVTLDAIGFKGVMPHPVRGFVLSEIGFPADDDLARKKMRTKIDQLIATGSDSKEAPRPQ